MRARSSRTHTLQRPGRLGVQADVTRTEGRGKDPGGTNQRAEERDAEERT